MKATDGFAMRPGLRRAAMANGLVLLAVMLLGGCGMESSSKPRLPPTVGWLGAGIAPAPLAVSAQETGRLGLGFGGEWDPGFWQPFNIEAGVTEAEWRVVMERLRWMRPAFVRMMMQTKWCYRDGADFDWETAEMKSLYRHLDFCQQEGIAVILTDWGCEPAWLKTPGIVDVGDPKYAAAIGGYMAHLLNTKGYRCIRYFVMVNEPNLEVKNWERWKQGFTQVADEFQRRGISPAVQMVGSDESGNERWHRNAVDQLRERIGVFDLHRYTTLEELSSGRLQQLLAGEWAYARRQDSRDGPPGVTMVGEAGMFSEGFSSSNNPLHEKYEYGVYMADYAVQALNAGSSGISAWMFDDSSHKGFTWGMWRDKAGGQKLKPWFYTWALLCRTVPQNAAIYALLTDADAAAPTGGVRGFAALFSRNSARADGAQVWGWSACLVNRSDRAQAVRLQFPADFSKAGGHPVQVYAYSPAQQTADEQGFPTPVVTLSGDLAQGCDLQLPANSVVIATTVR